MDNDLLRIGEVVYNRWWKSCGVVTYIRGPIIHVDFIWNGQIVNRQITIHDVWKVGEDKHLKSMSPLREQTHIQWALEYSKNYNEGK